MCSLHDYDNDGVQFITKEDDKVLDEMACKKCSNKAEILLRRKDSYCRDCFLMGATHKFRATLGKSKIVRPKDTVLVAYSGSEGSTALLHLIKAGMHELIHKRLVFKTIVVYIDEGAVTSQSIEERQANVAKISKEIENLGFIGYAIPLHKSLEELDETVQSIKLYKASTEGDDTLSKILNCLTSCTAKEEMIYRLRQRLLVSVGRQLKCNKIFVADNATKLAIRILSNISLGRGAQLPLDVGFVDNRFFDIGILRPMRDFTKEELLGYLMFHKLTVARHSNLSTEKSSYNTLQTLTEKFVNGLEAEFYGTVSAVFRTGEKLGNATSNDLTNICALCNAPLDTAITDSELCCIQATAFSQMISLEGPNDSNNKCDNTENKDTANDGNPDNCTKCHKHKCTTIELPLFNSENLKKYLCYGCTLILQDINDPKAISPFLLRVTKKKLHLEKMREEISDFLL
ncbi:cytoplasmic tRNA 2-thiolation protein 2 [Orussus abietinus]|uniref:cytoplasmic tRNA 2-thiolation protein 2 n=1 Tax=Orussus abietinus TaxID=222816 RepID=UPI0006252B03|nr:cytoplasmic tRNA 2-thiolation protein 2 [Orussus abietinus]